MQDLEKLIQDILREHAGSDLFPDKVYSDTPILYTASQMASYTPPVFRQMKELINSVYSGTQNREYIFYQQAKFMEQYEDNCPYTGDLSCYYPTYQQMNVAHLRGYFTWRTAVRKGEAKPGCSSFKFLYLYELLDLIGASDPTDAFEKLIQFWQTYRRFDHWMDSYLRVWLCDFAAYYSLPVALLQNVVDTGFENALYCLNHCTDTPDTDEGQVITDEQLLIALSVLSGYDPLHSRFYKQQPERYTRLICGGLRAYLRYTQKNNKISLSEKLFGRIHTHAYEMFGGAVFYDILPGQTTEYRIHDYYRYSCSNGKWQCTRLYCQRCKNRALGVLIKNMEAHIRERLSFSPPLKSEKPSRTLLALLDKEIDLMLYEEQADQRAAQQEEIRRQCQTQLDAIRLNTDLLGEIRRSADATRDKLLADIPIRQEEFPLDQPVATPSVLPVPPRQTVTPLKENLPTFADDSCDTSGNCGESSLFSMPEQTFLQALVSVSSCNAPYDTVTAAARSAGLTPDLLADTVNEKLLDIIGDTAVIFEDGKAVLLEDYLEDISQLL